MTALKEDVLTIVNYSDELFMKVDLSLVLTHLHISPNYTIGNDSTAVS